MKAAVLRERAQPMTIEDLTIAKPRGQEVLVRVNDRGPYVAGRIIDLSRAAATAIDMMGLGIKQVSLATMDDAADLCQDGPPLEPEEGAEADGD